ncbi:MAG: TMEM43 family protein [Verrucomicrobia bacterium]|nr:TMEM43 family protein [Verrucomicrobiota bacterium]MCH8527981.1 TMEM43 family protein [Kiritimatiellia bacterium]
MATKVTSQSWISRLGNSIKGILFGFVLFLGSFVLLWWNEGRAVQQYKQLGEVSLAAVEIQASNPPASAETLLVHVSGQTQTPDTIEDSAFGFTVTDSIHLLRSVEMYQWEESSRSETRTKVGGGQETVTTYSYDTTWSGRVIDSSRFYEQVAERRNPGSMPYQDRRTSATNVTLGNLTLASEIISRIGGMQTLSLRPDDVTLPEGAQLHGEYIYIGANPSAPQVGDVRVQFQAAPAQTVSILAGLQGNRLNQSWTDSGGRSYTRVQTGEHSKAAMIAQAEQEVKILTWILRLVGWIAMSSGMGMILAPMRIMADVLPFLGRIVGAGLGLITGLISGVLTLVTIAIAWVAVRPLIGVPLLIAAAVLLFFVIKKTRKAPVAPVPEAA